MLSSQVQSNPKQGGAAGEASIRMYEAVEQTRIVFSCVQEEESKRPTGFKPIIRPHMETLSLYHYWLKQFGYIICIIYKQCLS